MKALRGMCFVLVAFVLLFSANAQQEETSVIEITVSKKALDMFRLELLRQSDPNALEQLTPEVHFERIIYENMAAVLNRLKSDAIKKEETAISDQIRALETKRRQEAVKVKISKGVAP